VAEARVLLDTIAGAGLEALWLCALTGGLRRGEVLGLRWQDVDLDTSVVRIRQAVQRTDTGVVVTELKTDRSRRTVPIPVRTSAALKRHRAVQAEQRVSCPIPWPDNDLVFTTAIGTPLEPRNVNRSWYVVRRRAGLDWLRLHDLRHAYATFLIAAGASPRTVMAQLGHSQIALTMNTYAHVLEEVQREAVDRLGDTLFG
jgi:integrase